MDPISIAMSLAQFAPQVIRWVTGSEKAEEAATAVVDIAKRVTGKEDGDAALKELRVNPEAVLAFRQHIIDNETELDRLYLADTQSARDRDAKLAAAGQKNYRADVMFVLAIVVICGLVWAIWRSPDINEFMKGISTLVLGRFLGYLDQIYNFEFGTTRTSRTKDDTIKALSGK